ncbi:hypothetical protein LCGC14_1272680 [marine sediment metagenome]|uniref:Uncharacterized protein n=1 Tax=marine sediment metagenome TaxID=412755 RepID=A0A0F9NE92_9ZZZZ
MDEKELILHCAQVNNEYMGKAAGQVKGYEKITALYRRLSKESLACAQAWLEGKPKPPKHEPALDAFWWALVPWAHAMGRDMRVDQREWFDKFVKPHYAFARYLHEGHPFSGRWFFIDPQGAQRRGVPASVWPQLWPASEAWNVILYNDVRWTKMVIGLTARWGVLQHFKDLPALWQTLRLLKELAPPYRRNTQHEFLVSDVEFFHELFKPFSFSRETDVMIQQFLRRATVH